MQPRIVEIVLPSPAAGKVVDALEGESVINSWEQPINGDLHLVRLLIREDRADAVLDTLVSRFSAEKDFRVLLLAVEATLPRLDDSEESQDTKADEVPVRISREELYTDVSQGAELTRVTVVQVILSTLVAAVGLMRNDVAVIIGAMVIAPLLGTNVSLSLATTLGDVKLLARSLRTGAVNMVIAFIFSVAIGLLFNVDASIPAIASRTEVGLGDIVLGLAAGSAEVLAFTSGAPAAVIGVMVAVALLPPLVVAGLLLATGKVSLSILAMMLVLTNLICVNLAGVVTFLVQGVRPRTWWEAERARKSTRTAIALWAVLLAILIVVILIASRS